jgi:Kdo2-lipid IVA lauroyltransferase/acyltransferase
MARPLVFGTLPVMARPRAKSPSLLHPALYIGTRCLIAAASVPPISLSREGARVIGRWYANSPINRRHMKRAHGNLRVAFPDWPDDRIHRTAVQSHEHLVMFGAEMAYAPRLLTDDGWFNHIYLSSLEPALQALIGAGPCILITGHCGNWEILGYTLAVLGFPMHAVYRPLDIPALDRWVRRARSRRGLELVDKFGAVRRLPLLIEAGAPLGLVADQNGGDRGVFVPFFNRLTSTYKSIGLLALQYNARVVCGFAHRQAPGEGRDAALLGYQLRVTDAFGPEDWSSHPDPLFYLTARYRRAIEQMVRIAPDQYLWMHRIWRSRPRHERLGKPFPHSLLEKIRLLPWITDADIEQMKDHSRRDAATLAETGQTRLS